jgi:hypothetical protein
MFDLLFATVLKEFYQYLVIYNLSIAVSTQSNWDQELMAQMYVLVYA